MSNFVNFIKVAVKKTADKQKVDFPIADMAIDIGLELLKSWKNKDKNDG